MKRACSVWVLIVAAALSGCGTGNGGKELELAVKTLPGDGAEAYHTEKVFLASAVAEYSRAALQILIPAFNERRALADKEQRLLNTLHYTSAEVMSGSVEKTAKELEAYVMKNGLSLGEIFSLSRITDEIISGISALETTDADYLKENLYDVIDKSYLALQVAMKLWKMEVAMPSRDSIPVKYVAGSRRGATDYTSGEETADLLMHRGQYEQCLSILSTLESVCGNKVEASRYYTGRLDEDLFRLRDEAYDPVMLSPLLFPELVEKPVKYFDSEYFCNSLYYALQMYVEGYRTADQLKSIIGVLRGYVL